MRFLFLFAFALFIALVFAQEQEEEVDKSEIEFDSYDHDNEIEHDALPEDLQKYVPNKFHKPELNDIVAKLALKRAQEHLDELGKGTKQRKKDNGAKVDPRKMKLRTLRGFEFCSHLNNAVFDENVELRTGYIKKVLKQLKIEWTEALKKRNGWERIKKFFKQLGKWFQQGKWHKTPEYRVPKLFLRDITDMYPRVVDELAKSLYAQDISTYKLWDRNQKKNRRVGIHSSKMFACYVVADGFNSWIKLGRKRRVLQFVDGKTYFGKKFGFDSFDMDLAKWELEHADEILDVDKLGTTKIPTLDNRMFMKPKLAYMLLVHKDFEDVLKLLERLYDDSVAIVIHVDGKNKKLRQDIAEYLQTARYDSNRVQLSRTTFKCSWGHSTLVFAQLSAFFQLLEMDDSWEYIINLSGNDYPLLKNTDIYQTLKENEDSQWIQYFETFQATTRTQAFPYFQSDDEDKGAGQAFWSGWSSNPEFKLEKPKVPNYKPYIFPKFRFLTFPYPNWKPYKQHQWMILTRKFVEAMKRSPTTMVFLAFSEFTEIPDEHFFINLAAHLVTVVPGTDDERYRIKVINNMRRFLEFKGMALHPRQITMEDLELLRTEVVENGHLFTRKVEMSQETRLIEKIKREQVVLWEVDPVLRHELRAKFEQREVEE